MNCLNCNKLISDDDDFCSSDCYQEYISKNPGYENKYDRHHCGNCGSPDISITDTKIELLETGNVLVPGSFKKRRIKIEKYSCGSCDYEGQNWIILDSIPAPVMELVDDYSGGGP
jgi:ribosomal protein S27AE